MTRRIYFDQSLPMFAALVVNEWSDAALINNLFLRDVTGKLTFIVLDISRTIVERSALAAKAQALLGNYVDAEGFAVSTPAELFDVGLEDKSVARTIHIHTDEFVGTVNLIDRRLVGADWLRAPAASAKLPKRFVFASIKGGVGRSTALCVVAEHFASRGKRVLAIDMDIEAPGLGNMLLPEGTLPEFGLLDFLVEQNFGIVDDQFLVDMIGSSWLGGGRGRVDVLPAIGKRSLDNPANVLAKLARAYLAGVGDSPGDSTSFADHISGLVDILSDPLRYDIILIDARAGLHETTAAAVVGLGAEVLCFGLDQPQTFAGYKLLLSHLATLPIDSADDWRERLYFVQAKAPASLSYRENFKLAMNRLFDDMLWPTTPSLEDEVDLEPLKDTFEMVWGESETALAPLGATDSNSYILAVLDDDRYHSFDPLSDRDALSEPVYQQTFGEILEKVEQLLGDIKRSNIDAAD